MFACTLDTGEALACHETNHPFLSPRPFILVKASPRPIVLLCILHWLPSTLHWLQGILDYTSGLQHYVDNLVASTGTVLKKLSQSFRKFREDVPLEAFS